MAIQADGSKNKPVETTATGNAKDTGTPVSLAPTKPPRFKFSDDFGGTGTLNYGHNRQDLPSSIEPGTTVESDLASDLRTTVGEPVLDAVQKYGTAAMKAPEVGDTPASARGTPDGQLRKLSANAAPDHPAMSQNRSRQPSYPGPKASIPGAVTDNGGEPDRQP